MRYFALACDFDQTLADQGVVAKSTLSALERLVSTGRKLVLVTGRQLPDLKSIFPEITMFERVAAENGAVLYRPSREEIRLLADPVPEAFIDALRRDQVPMSPGSVIVNASQADDTKIFSIIRELGFELQVIYNKGAAMILPSGINKGTGLLAALSEMSISDRNVVAVGDAENDHALLRASECAVAVANSIPSLKQQADYVTSSPNGKGVEELIDRLLADDLRAVPNRLTRRPVLLGTTHQGRDICIDAYDTNLLIAGPSSGGKSTFMLGLLERLTESGFQLCIMDPEGDYPDVKNIVTLGSSEGPPNPVEILQILAKPTSSLVINLVGLPLVDRPVFFSTLLPRLQELRSKSGHPHWIILDEAHHLFPGEHGQAARVLPQQFTGMILITVNPAEISDVALKSMAGIIAVGPNPQETIRAFSCATGFPLPGPSLHSAQPGDAVAWLIDSPQGPVAMRVQAAATPARRHKRKYAQGKLGPDRSFFFRGPGGKMNLRAQNLNMFVEIAQGIDEDTWLYHLRRGDYSQWLREAIKDESLANEVHEIENDGKDSPRRTRSAVIEAITRRYTASA